MASTAVCNEELVICNEVLVIYGESPLRCSHLAIQLVANYNLVNVTEVYIGTKILT